MSQDHLVKLKSTKSPDIYWTRRSRKSKGFQNNEKLELMKYDKNVRKKVLYKQTKK